MFSHILVPVDGSAASDRAVHTAVAMAKAFGAQLALVCVMDPHPYSGVGADMAFAQGEYLDAATAEARQVIDRAREQCKASAVTVTSSVVEGPSVYAAIIEAAEAAGPAGADLIVMGSHGLRGLEKLILGSVTAQVLSHSHVPVMVVRG
jgi:nucleotide-binding universal stress UspA family protein